MKELCLFGNDTHCAMRPQKQLQQCFVIISITTRNFDAKIFTKVPSTPLHRLCSFRLLILSLHHGSFCSYFLLSVLTVLQIKKIGTNTLRDGCYKKNAQVTSK